MDDHLTGTVKRHPMDSIRKACAAVRADLILPYRFSCGMTAKQRVGTNLLAICGFARPYLAIYARPVRRIGAGAWQEQLGRRALVGQMTCREGLKGSDITK